jgi:quercetin dioxygenase-like cupin family protein
LTAHYRCFAFAPHVHEAYSIALSESGAERFRYRGAKHVAVPGDLALLNPDEVHTGSHAQASEWR